MPLPQTSLTYLHAKPENSLITLKNQPCGVIKLREMNGEVGKKTPKKEMDIPSFL